MPTLISQATRIQAAGNRPKLIDEYIGRVNSKTSGVSVAHMRSPGGWVEPGQKVVVGSWRTRLFTQEQWEALFPPTGPEWSQGDGEDGL